MPAELLVDREKVKMVALQVGVREAARQFELSENTVMAWSHREGWFSQVKEAQQVKEIVVARQGVQAAARITGSEVMVRLGEKSKLRAAKVGDNTLKAISRKKDDKLIACAPAFKATVDSLAKIHEWGTSTTTTNLAIQINGAQVPDCR